jgi:adenylate kinase
LTRLQREAYTFQNLQQRGAGLNILLFGPNGSGKGTQGALLKQKFNLAHIESGAIFREHCGIGTELGKQAKAYMERGDLVPDDITIPMVLETLKSHGEKGWLLDGFPRNLLQAEKLWEAMQASDLTLDYVVEILLPRATAKSRIAGRRICSVDNNHPNNVHIAAIKPEDGKCRVCGGTLSERADDQDENAVNKRHDIYYDEKNGTLAAIRFFQGLAAQGKCRYIALDGQEDINTVKDTLLAELA